MITKKFLITEYQQNKKSVREVSLMLKCSQNTVTYWLNKHQIPKRTISEAIYQYSNPNGDPFKYKKPRTEAEFFLYGLGLGLFWGEGNKVNKHSVRLGNTDPALVRTFIDFLIQIYQIDKNRLRFGLQLFSDIKAGEAIAFWTDYLQVSEKYFYKVTVTRSTSKGTYKKRNQTGVITVYFSNLKLRDTIMTAIAELRSGKLPS